MDNLVKIGIALSHLHILPPPLAAPPVVCVWHLNFLLLIQGREEREWEERGGRGEIEKKRERERDREIKKGKIKQCRGKGSWRRYRNRNRYR